jgi:cytochrome c-type biogenesis protein CcmH
MLFWVSAAFLTCVCACAALFPLMRSAAGADRRESHDLEVYKDQLKEIARDQTAGIMSADDAQTAEIEVSRRILKAASQSRAAQAAAPARLARVSALVIAALLPIVSWGAYMRLGTLDLPDQPIALRQTPDAADSIETLVAKAEAHLAKNPDDGRGWDVLAPIYARMGRFDEAVTAYSRAIELNKSSSARESGLGEALAGAAGGKVTPDARSAFARALTLDPNEPKARLFMAMGLAQEGKTAEAKAALENQLASSPANAPWRPVVERALASLQKSAAGKIAKGPSQDQVDAAAKMSGGDRTAMVETMVAGLAERLKANPDNVSDWQKLIRSYLVLGKKDDAVKALENAQTAFKQDTAKQDAIRAFAKELGLTGS